MGQCSVGSEVFRMIAVGKIMRVVLFLLFACCYIAIGSLSSHAREIPVVEVTATEIDYALRDALLAENFQGFSDQLALGGDPTAWFENSREGWVLCAATQSGREKYLQLLIDSDSDINYLQSNINTLLTLPLGCAVTFDNIRAMEMLIAAGANPALQTCLKCGDRFPMSILAEAVIVRKYDLAVWLVDKGDYSDEQVASVIYMIEKSPVDESATINEARLELVQRIRDLGFKISPWTRDKD